MASPLPSEISHGGLYIYIYLYDGKSSGLSVDWFRVWQRMSFRPAIVYLYLYIAGSDIRRP